MRNILRLVLCAGLLAVALGPADAIAQEGRGAWMFETGALGGYHSNFFFRGEGLTAPSTTMFNIYANAEGEYRKGANRYTFLFDVGAVRTGDISSGDYYSLLSGLEFRRRSNRVTGEFFLMPNRVYDDEGDGVFFDSLGTELQYRRVLGPGLWVRADYGLELWRFDPVDAERDSTTHDLSGSVRVPLSERVGVRGSFYYGIRIAEAERYNFNSVGVAVALEAQPTERIQIFVRYKVRSRDYNDASLGDNNYLREDTVHDVVANLRWLLGDRWGIRIENFYRTGSSTREDRNYSGNRLLAGAFLLF